MAFLWHPQNNPGDISLVQLTRHYSPLLQKAFFPVSALALSALPYRSNAHHLGLSLLQISLLVTLNGIAALTLKPIMGWAADRFGLKFSFTTAVGLRSLVALCLVFAHSPWQLYAIKSLHGTSKALRDPAASALIAEQGGKKAIASAFAWYHTAKTMAGSLGKAIAGILLTLTVSNFSLVFTIAFCLSIIPLYTVVRHVREGPTPNQPSVPTAPLTALPPNDPVKQSSPLSLDAKLVILPFTLLTFLITGTAEMLRGLFPILATEYAGLSEAQTGLIYTTSSCIVLISGPLFGWLSDRGQRKLVLLVRSAGNIMSSFIYLAAPGFSGLVMGKLVDDVGKTAFRPAWGSLMAHVSSFNRRHRAQTMSWMILGEDAGTIVGPILAGFLWTTWGLAMMLSVRILLAIATEVYVTVLNQTLVEQTNETKGSRLRLGNRRLFLNLVPSWLRQTVNRR